MLYALESICAVYIVAHKIVTVVFTVLNCFSMVFLVKHLIHSA